MKYALLLSATLLSLAACTPKEPAKNPDPNHTHADFAVWIGGGQIDFSGEQYMSGSSAEAEHADAHDEYYHLHDGNGHVVHRHKPGLPIGQFFDSLPGMRYEGDQFKFLECLQCQHAQGSYTVRLYVNGEEQKVGSAYVFNDNDHLLITDTVDPVQLRKEIRMVTDDACMYSKTCPERGEPPTENCIADPTVPCVVR